jgi:hypothetical protein
LGFLAEWKHLQPGLISLFGFFRFSTKTPRRTIEKFPSPSTKPVTKFPFNPLLFLSSQPPLLKGSLPSPPPLLKGSLPSPFIFLKGLIERLYQRIPLII